MKTAATRFSLVPGLAAKLKGFEATHRVKKRNHGDHKILICYAPGYYTHHDMMAAVRSFYPEARMVSNERDGDYHDIVTINLHDTQPPSS